ncbi:MAG: ABC transporter permease [Dysgonamonadaceae bacterium]|jgi:putative ABC transport system permease protein|nr:ABC transporter permease [Dysgonamonadaceae bacterium]
MNILSSYKRTRFFLWVNVIGLAIGLAASIMLILFVVNELSYDKHFANNERIVRLINALEINGETQNLPITLRKAYMELPENVPGIEAATQILQRGKVEIIHETEHFQNLNYLSVDSSFFKVFQLKFVEGTPDNALESTNAVVITRKQAEIIFGSASHAINQAISIRGKEFTITAIVEELPVNTHFTFDILTCLSGEAASYEGLEYFTYYLIKLEAPLKETMSSIEKEYTSILAPFTAQFNAKAYGITEKLTNIYLHSIASFSLGKSNDMKFVWLLAIIALFVLALAIVNFVNLFMAQGETRMNEIGIRKANGANIYNIVRQFFTEVSGIVLIAFVAGLLLTVIATPYFAQLIHKDIDLVQLLNPTFVGCMVALFVLTVTLSAGYPSFYMSRFTPLDILAKRLKFSKRQLTTTLIVFQSIVTIVLISYILVINKQTDYLQKLPKNYNPENVMMVPANQAIRGSYESLKQELLNTPGIQKVSGGNHAIGGGASGQGITLLEERESVQLINEYRILPGLCELMEFQLAEGEFFKENAPDSVNTIVLNESALKMLGLQMPVVGKHVEYQGDAEIIGVVKDFIFLEPTDPVQPLVLSSYQKFATLIYIRFDKNISRMEAQESALTVFRKFDSEFVINPVWSEDIYTKKFDTMKMQAKVVLIGSLLSVFIAMIGLLAIHLYTAKRRTKEIGIRRINGATPQSIFSLLSYDVLKWIVLAGIIATPLAWYIASDWLNNYKNHTSLSWTLFVLPVLIQCLVAILTTSGVSLNVLSRNPVEALKTE